MSGTYGICVHFTVYDGYVMASYKIGFINRTQIFAAIPILRFVKNILKLADDVLITTNASMSPILFANATHTGVEFTVINLRIEDLALG